MKRYEYKQTHMQSLILLFTFNVCDCDHQFPWTSIKHIVSHVKELLLCNMCDRVNILHMYLKSLTVKL